jgi:hypothetical protein
MRSSGSRAACVPDQPPRYAYILVPTKRGWYPPQQLLA